MSFPYISRQPVDANLKGYQAIFPGNYQTINSFTATQASSASFSQGTSIIRLFATQDCFLDFGPTPSATAGSTYFLPGGIVQFVGVNGGTDKLAVVRSANNGILYIAEGR